MQTLKSSLENDKERALKAKDEIYKELQQKYYKLEVDKHNLEDQIKVGERIDENYKVKIKQKDDKIKEIEKEKENTTKRLIEEEKRRKETELERDKQVSLRQAMSASLNTIYKENEERKEEIKRLNQNSERLIRGKRLF